MFNEYLNAVSVEEKMKYLFYDPSLKQEVLAYYHTFKDEKLEDVKVERVMEEMVNTQKVWSMVYSHGHGQNQSQDWLYFRKDKANDYKIDWKSHVNYQAASVNEAIVSKLSERV